VQKLNAEGLIVFVPGILVFPWLLALYLSGFNLGGGLSGGAYPFIVLGRPTDGLLLQPHLA
jgi:hypothetical protein